MDSYIAVEINENQANLICRFLRNKDSVWYMKNDELSSYFPRHTFFDKLFCNPFDEDCSFQLTELGKRCDVEYHLNKYFLCIPIE